MATTDHSRASAEHPPGFILTQKATKMTIAKTVEQRRSDAPTAAEKPVNASKREPHPIYGNAPIGTESYRLKSMPLAILDRWHEKAIKLASDLSASLAPDDTQSSDGARTTALEILDAAFQSDISCTRDLAALLQIVAPHSANMKDVDPLNAERLTPPRNWLSRHDRQKLFLCAQRDVS